MFTDYNTDTGHAGCARFLSIQLLGGRGTDVVVGLGWLRGCVGGDKGEI